MAYRYLSFSDSIRSNGDRHMANARRHAEMGRKEYAFGSFKKAIRNYKKADDFDRLFAIPSVFRPAYDAMLDAMTRNIYESTSVPGDGGFASFFGAVR